jgi:hypothetical protein
VGSIDRKLPVLLDINQPVGGVRPFDQYPTLATIETAFRPPIPITTPRAVAAPVWNGIAATF